MKSDDEKPVFLLKQAEEYLDDGGELEIRCLEDPKRVGQNHTGLWRVYVVKESEPEKVLVAYNSVKPRDLKTLNSVASIVYKLNLKNMRVPMYKGNCERWTKKDFRDA
ncbi:hypothetical protein [Ruegeria sp. ANG-R]|uniref:hypothetical protein n=1 Tax=Ruegeria sp. ANG-R TaxID=1577903 RepID=UPI000B302935|nr:hypothetical protein [Ruegeria sp. ANG-R]